MGQKGQIEIAVNMLCFHERDNQKNDTVRDFMFEWTGKFVDQNEQIEEHKDRCQNDLLDLVKSFQKAFGAKLKDVNNEFKVVITSPPTRIVGDTQMSDKHYNILRQLNFDELSDLTIMLNEIGPEVVEVMVAHQL